MNERFSPTINIKSILDPTVGKILYFLSENHETFWVSATKVTQLVGYKNPRATLADLVNPENKKQFRELSRFKSKEIRPNTLFLNANGIDQLLAMKNLQDSELIPSTKDFKTVYAYLINHPNLKRENISTPFSIQNTTQSESGSSQKDDFNPESRDAFSWEVDLNISPEWLESAAKMESGLENSPALVEAKRLELAKQALQILEKIADQEDKENAVQILEILQPLFQPIFSSLPQKKSSPFPAK